MNVNLLKKFVQNSKKCNKIVNTLLCHGGFCTPRYSRQNGSFTELGTYQKCLQRTMATNFDPPRRCYCQGEDKGPPPSSHKLPPLMHFPPHIWPSVFQSFKNLILATFIIKPYFDPEFSIPDFILGSKKAVEVVSHKLKNNEDLSGLVSSDILPKLQETVSHMTLGQRDLLPVKTEDIYFAFPYQIGIMFSDENTSENPQRFVEITMVYHTLKDLAALKTQSEEAPLTVGFENKDKFCVCNYRFVKEFTRGVDSDWTVNLLNHFRPIDDEY